jgi:hypothetical protein
MYAVAADADACAGKGVVRVRVTDSQGKSLAKERCNSKEKTHAQSNELVSCCNHSNSVSGDCFTVREGHLSTKGNDHQRRRVTIQFSNLNTLTVLVTGTALVCQTTTTDTRLLTVTNSGAALFNRVLNGSSLGSQTLIEAGVFMKAGIAGTGAALIPSRRTAYSHMDFHPQSGDLSRSRLSIGHASQLLRSKKVSSVELTQDCLRRIEQLNPKLNAFITVMGETAMLDATTDCPQQRSWADNYNPIGSGIHVEQDDLSSPQFSEHAAVRGTLLAASAYRIQPVFASWSSSTHFLPRRLARNRIHLWVYSQKR